ncbi:MAG: TIGR00730 family Rossman fold protein [Gammaproteobacteria bacterium]|nr:TIGR00730 family Rossman fold protein [Gammaproteobacteria bacterium]NIR85259.1 TIGR00730 family Rossman fold protein [Gammaproteobacteria bacterium]NIR88375.1 TIGR00730 family Rossman fold protein [Gammaproteobacteria bacterium]NIU06325.1 TIGR00730 family Rossman fold protein [Gammaproteobacteria bacterium]NIV53224.1 TIGR00730 family Rossman fold protein [Gammaproteobacteria bacterium]
MMRICVFCGSSLGTHPQYLEAVRGFAREAVAKGITLVYGGGKVGLMGVLADAALQTGGQVVGVMTRALQNREIAHEAITELHIVETMHERKAKMAELADAFVALPGGAGTLEEICEQWTWAQLGIHRKPCGFLNVQGYYDPLRSLIDHMTAEGFVRSQHRAMLLFEQDAPRLIASFRSYTAPASKWEEGETPKP